MAPADDQRWRRFADVIVHREPPSEPLLVAANTLHELPGCALVAVPIRDGGCVVAVRGRQPVIIGGRLDVEVVAAEVYSALLKLARNPAALGSSTCS